MDELASVFAKSLGVVLVLTLLLGSVVVIDQTERGVLLRFGKFVGVLEPGLHFKFPIVDKVIIYGITQKTLDMTRENTIKTLTSDGLEATVDVSIVWHVEDPEKAYKKLGFDLKNWLVAKVRGVARSSIAKYTAEALYTEARESLEKDMYFELIKRTKGSGIVIDDVLIRDVNLPEKVKHAIEFKMQKQQEALAMQYQLEKAKIEAQIEVVEAQAQANQTIIKAKGEAEAIRIIQEQLARSPLYIQYLFVQKWNGKMPIVLGDASTMIWLPNVTAER